MSDADQERGAYRKFIVRRADGSDAPGCKHDGCTYFVLDLRHDEHARDAMSAYADSCAVSHPKLAEDIRGALEASISRCGCREAGCPHTPFYDLSGAFAAVMRARAQSEGRS